MRLIADLHTHTYASGHAYSTLKENVEQAKEEGLSFLGVSDHTPGMAGTTDLLYFQNLKVVKKKVKGVQILLGAEANIIGDTGEIDLPDETASQLDYVIASLHVNVINNMGLERNTNAVIGAMQNRNIKIIGHPDDSTFPLDYPAIVAQAKESGVALEVNNSSLSPNSSRKNTRENIAQMLRICKELDTPIIVNSDSHVFFDVGKIGYAKALLKELCFPTELIINTNELRFQEFMARGKRLAPCVIAV